ncbi:MAG: AI-2E family transporter [Bdellovibrionaceae bacterium]|nr:AI-2E family transporter [Pseudobdellovibrionaceae bacterium]
MTKHQQKNLKVHFIKLFSFLSVLGLSVLLILKVDNLLLSSLLAFVISYLLGPLVNYMERRGLNRVASIMFLFSAMSLTIFIGLSSLYPLISSQLSSLKSDLPKYITGTTQLIKDTEANFSFLTAILLNFDLSEYVESLMTTWASSLFEDFPKYISKSLTTAMLAPFLAFFLLKDGQRILKSIFSLVPNRFFELSINLQHQINDQMGGFIRARMLEATIVGFVVWAGLWLIHFPYAPLLATFAALTNLIPYIGPLIGMVPPLIIALINGTPFIGLFLVLLPYAIAQIIDMFVIIPLVVAKIVDLHPVTVIISFIIGAQVMGVLGMIISIPVTSILKVTTTTVYKHLIEFTP